MRTFSGLIMLLTFLIFSCGTTEKPQSSIQKPYSGTVIEKDYQYTKTFYETHDIEFYIHLENITDSEESAKLIEELIYKNKSFDDYAAYLEAEFPGVSEAYPPFINDDGTQYIYHSSLMDHFKINYHDDNFILLNYNNYYYTGGAHGNYEIRYYIIDIAAGKLLEITDLITQIPESVLLHILSENYDTDGFFQRDIWPPDTITFKTEGVELFWNVYSITPYAMGPVSAVIPYPAADSYLTEKGNQIKERIINKN